MKNCIKKVTMGGLILFGFSSNIFAGSGCDHTNFKEYIYNEKKMRRLLKETGKGCQLKGAKLNEANLEGGVPQRKWTL